MNIFTQLVLVVGRITPKGVDMLGTGFLVTKDGRIATTRHVVSTEDVNLIVLAPQITDINEFQDISDKRCQPVGARIDEMDPIRDLAILRADLSFPGDLPAIGDFDSENVGDEVGIFGFPHCVKGRRALTFQKGEIGAKVLLESNGVVSKHAVINTQAQPGQSGSPIFSTRTQTICGVLMGAWALPGGTVTVAGVDPRGLHQTTHCISAEYIREML